MTQEDLSRFGRNSIETGYFIERVFPLFHTRFISVSDDFDTNNFRGDTGGMDVTFKYLINEYYSRDMSMKTKSAKHAKMQRGEYQSKICPYGYRKSDDGRMEPDPEAAAVVQLIYELAASGTSAAEIARELFRRGIPTPGEYKAAHGNHTHDISRTHGIWCSSTVLRILEDERYIGSYVIGKRAVIEVGGSRSRMKDREKWHIIPDHHPAIIDKALFEQVQATQRRFSQPHISVWRRTARTVGTIRPATGIGTTRPIGTRTSVSAPPCRLLRHSRLRLRVRVLVILQGRGNPSPCL